MAQSTREPLFSGCDFASKWHLPLSEESDFPVWKQFQKDLPYLIREQLINRFVCEYTKHFKKRGDDLDVELEIWTTANLLTLFCDYLRKLNKDDILSASDYLRFSVTEDFIKRVINPARASCSQSPIDAEDIERLDENLRSEIMYLLRPPSSTYSKLTGAFGQQFLQSSATSEDSGEDPALSSPTPVLTLPQETPAALQAQYLPGLTARV